MKQRPINEIIKALRLSNNVTQTTVATALGLHQANYVRLENGKSELTISRLTALASFFNVTPESILTDSWAPFSVEETSVKKIAPVNYPAYLNAADDVIQDMYHELRRAKQLFPDLLKNQHEGYAVILEEIDELWTEIKKNPKAYDLAAQRKEAIQAGAMIVRFVVELLDVPTHK